MVGFSPRGWEHGYDTLDLGADLAGYRPPAAAARAVGAGVSQALATAGDRAEVMALEAAAPCAFSWQFSITQFDAVCQLAGIRPVADGPGQP